MYSSDPLKSLLGAQSPLSGSRREQQRGWHRGARPASWRWGQGSPDAPSFSPEQGPPSAEPQQQNSTLRGRGHSPLRAVRRAALTQQPLASGVLHRPLPGTDNQISESGCSKSMRYAAAFICLADSFIIRLGFSTAQSTFPSFLRPVSCP